MAGLMPTRPSKQDVTVETVPEDDVEEMELPDEQGISKPWTQLHDQHYQRRQQVCVLEWRHARQEPQVTTCKLNLERSMYTVIQILILE